LLARVARGRGTFFEAVPVPDGAFARVIGHFKILCEFQSIGRAGVFAKAAEHATRSVVGESGEDFAARGVVAFPTDYDEIFGAGEGAEVAADAERFAGFGMIVEAGRAAIAFGNHGAFEGILLGVDVFRVLRAEGDAHALEHIQLKNPLDEFFHDDSLFGPGADVKDSWGYAE